MNPINIFFICVYSDYVYTIGSGELEWKKGRLAAFSSAYLAMAHHWFLYPGILFPVIFISIIAWSERAIWSSFNFIVHHHYRHYIHRFVSTSNTFTCGDQGSGVHSTFPSRSGDNLARGHGNTNGRRAVGRVSEIFLYPILRISVIFLGYSPRDRTGAFLQIRARKGYIVR